MANVCAVRTFSYSDHAPKPHEPVLYMGREGSRLDSNTISVEKPKPYFITNVVGLYEKFHKCKHCGNLFSSEDQ